MKSNVSSARDAALSILMEIDYDKKYANISLKEKLKSSDFSNLDSAFITQLVYGTLEKQITIDWIISKFAKAKRIKPVIKNILRLGCYQIIYMDRIPDSAACNESVKLCKKRGLSGLGGFVNGVLRNISRKKDGLNNMLNVLQPDERLSVEYSYPLWMVKKWINDYGYETAVDIMKDVKSDGFTSIRVNTYKSEVQEIIDVFRSHSVEVKKGILDESLSIKEFGDIEGNPLYKEGLITVQGESSMLVTHILDPSEGDKILDTCSSPGGKATHIAEYINMNGHITAWDIHPHRVELINKNTDRMGASIIKAEVKDASDYDSTFESTMDKVLIDAPCSGWGIINKKPDIKLKPEMDLSELLGLQFSILTTCSRYVKPGGILVYSTCTINIDENDKMIENFLATKDDFELVDFAEDLPNGLRNSYRKNGMIQLIPSINNIDGFFIAKLRRKR